MPKPPSPYSQILERVFFSHYKRGLTEFDFDRAEMETAAKDVGIQLPKNLGAILYDARNRRPLPAKILAATPKGKMWTIQSRGKSRYRFVLASDWMPIPNPNYEAIKVPDATPGIVEKYRMGDEQALLARMRYNRLIDLFTGLTCYSLQNHRRIGVSGIGQVETDEIYIGIDQRGAHYVIPVEAKGERERLGIIQIAHNLALAAEHFGELICRPMAAQFLTDGTIALLEFTSGEKGIVIRQETHYRLVPPDELTDEDLARYRAAL
jgi:hypothetical protein